MIQGFYKEKMLTRKKPSVVDVVLWASVLCVAVCVTSTVNAQSKTPKVYLMETSPYKDEVPSIVSPKIHDTFKERLSSDPRVSLMEKGEAGKAAKGGSNAALNKANEFYNSGIGLLVVEDFKGSRKAFEDAIAMYTKHLADLTDWESFEDAHLRLAVAAHKGGDDKAARNTLRIYMSMKPDAKLSSDNFPQMVVEFAEKEGKRIFNKGKGKLSVTSEPSGADVIVDGKVIGQTPLKVEIGVGDHYVVVKGKGAFPMVKKVGINRGFRGTNIAADLKSSSATGSTSDGPVFFAELERRLSTGEVDDGMLPYLSKLTAKLGSSHVVFVVVRKGKGSYDSYPFIYSAEANKLVILESFGFDTQLSRVAVDAYRLSVGVINALAAFPAGQEVTTNPFEEMDKAAAAAAAAAAVVVVPKPTPTYTPTPTPLPKMSPKPAPKPKVATKPAPRPTVATKPAPRPKVVTRPELPAVEPNNGGVSGGAAGWDSGVEEGGEEASDELLDAWWLWTGVGVVVLSGAVAGGYLLFSEDDDSGAQGFSATVRW